MPTIEPRDIASVIVDGQVVYYRPREVIAVGTSARASVEQWGGTFGSDRADELVREVRGQEAEERRISALPPAFRLTGVEDPLEIVRRAREHGLRVQLNHVHFAHCGCRCDPCCGSQRFGANPYRATGYLAKPYRATPYRATPSRTSAVPATQQALPEPEEAEVGSDSPVTVWILDTGLAAEGEKTSLDGRGVVGTEVDRPDQSPKPPDGLIDPVAGHGTFIAGIIEDQAPGCAIVVRWVIGSGGDVDEWDVSNAIFDLLKESVGSPTDLARTILSMSFGGGLYDACNPVVGEAIAAAQEAGVVVIASAGNEASCAPVYPAHFPGVVAVGAVDADGEPADFTNFGSWVQACALGVDVVSTFFETTETGNPPDGGSPLKDFTSSWAIWSGTSFAAPVVVAAIAQRLLDEPQTLATDAMGAVLSEGTRIPCLGVWVNPSRAERLVAEARPVPDDS